MPYMVIHLSSSSTKGHGGDSNHLMHVPALLVALFISAASEKRKNISEKNSMNCDAKAFSS
jgi:hypothetical protein